MTKMTEKCISPFFDKCKESLPIFINFIYDYQSLDLPPKVCENWIQPSPYRKMPKINFKTRLSCFNVKTNCFILKLKNIILYKNNFFFVKKKFGEKKIWSKKD